MTDRQTLQACAKVLWDRSAVESNRRNREGSNNARQLAQLAEQLDKLTAYQTDCLFPAFPQDVRPDRYHVSLSGYGIVARSNDLSEMETAYENARDMANKQGRLLELWDLETSNAIRDNR